MFVGCVEVVSEMGSSCVLRVYVSPLFVKSIAANVWDAARIGGGTGQEGAGVL